MTTPHSELTEKIIGSAYTVYNTMGYGFLESVYEKCMLIELDNSGLKVESQKPTQVTYQGLAVGDFIADLIVEDKIIVELKSVRHLCQAHEVQLVNYLKATGKEVGLLINFAEKTVEVKRRLFSLPSYPVNPVNPV
ncbi:MAG: GxxExxY protein [Planctomycetota bacterium]|jgi:GxxExxY protein